VTNAGLQNQCCGRTPGLRPAARTQAIRGQAIPLRPPDAAVPVIHGAQHAQRSRLLKLGLARPANGPRADATQFGLDALVGVS